MKDLQSEHRAKKKRNKPQDFSKLHRNTQVKIRLTDEERTALKNASGDAGLCLADYVMACVHSKPIIRIPGIARLRMELVREGRNLNQALHLAHGDRKLGKSIDWELIVGTVRKVEANMNMLSDLIRKWDADISEQIGSQRQAEEEAKCQL